MTKRHVLKVWPSHFDAVDSGKKPWEVRDNRDRDFSLGDFLELREYDPQSHTYTGRILRCEVTYLTLVPFNPHLTAMTISGPVRCDQ